MIRKSGTEKSLLLTVVCLKGGYNAVQGDFSVKRDFFSQQLAPAEQPGLSSRPVLFLLLILSLADSASLISNTGFGPFVGIMVL